MKRHELCRKAAIALCGLVVLAGCRSTSDYRRQADEAAARRLAAAQQAALGRSEAVQVAPAADTLRRQLLITQDLPRSAAASLSIRDVPDTPYWEAARHLAPATNDPALPETAPRLTLGLPDAIQVGARNSDSFQQAKEDLFLAALELDLQHDDFRNTFSGLLSGAGDYQGADDGDATQTVRGSAELGWSRRLLNGVELSSRIMVDLVKLLTQEAGSSLGLFADASITIPLLRGAGYKVAAESLRQSEQNLLYAVYTFERFKREFAVRVADEYLGVLQDKQRVLNAEQNYRRLIAAARRSRRLADAGRLPEFQFDQAVQDELRARSRWIAARQSYAGGLDAFKTSLGLPPDARIELDAAELDRLQAIADRMSDATERAMHSGRVPPADAPIELEAPGRRAGGPLEMAPEDAIHTALESRLDLRTAAGRLGDAQRAVYIAADALRAELTLLGEAGVGERRTAAGDAGQANADLNVDEGAYGALLSLDLPFERTAERNAYRRSLIDLQRAVRDLQAAEDAVKLDIQNGLRDLRQARQELQIQLQAVALAEKRVRSTDLFLQAGRVDVRDVLESQEALLNAQNALIAAVVDYRIAELALQRDLGRLQVSADGIWNEYRPEETEP